MPRKKSAAKKAREAEAKLVEGDKVAPVETPAKEEVTPKDIQDSGSENDSSSEDEDDYGELITEEVEHGIQSVISAIRNNDMDTLLDDKVKFFEDPAKAVKSISVVEKQKPIYLKDYHRMNLMSGETFKDDESDHETVDGQKSYVAQQTEEKQKLLDEIKNAFDVEDEDKSGLGSGDEDEDEDDFLKKKSESSNSDTPKVHLPDPTADEEAFLDEFVNQQAWIPKKGDKIMTGDGEMKIEEDDEEFEDAVEQFEHAYNFRYEDPNAAEIVSYARNQATLRRSDNSSRRRKREDEKEEKNSQKKKKEDAIHKKKTEKVHKLTDVLEQLKKEYGADINESMVKKITNTLLNNEYKDDEWDQVITELFNDEFYDQEGKPTWDDNDALMEGIDMSDNDNEFEEQKDEHDDDVEVSEKTKSRKEKKHEKKSKKQEMKNLNKLVENAVEQNKLAILEEVEKEQEERKSRSRSRSDDAQGFRYREVSPESFGLTTREIFDADDSQLNQFIGLKKFAPYRPKELRMKDKRKVTKSKRIREWRNEVFKNEKGLADTNELEFPVEKSKKSHNHHKSHKKNKHRKS